MEGTKMNENIPPGIDRNVGYYPRPVAWPVSIKEVNAAPKDQLLEWYRFLPAAEDQGQMAIINRIVELLF